MIYGCDEAGKGPVLGSMFVVCVAGNKESIPDGMKDSKKLSTNRIHNLAEDIREEMEVSVIEVTTHTIDSKSMTEVSVAGFTKAISQVSFRNCTDGYIDCFINNKKTVEDRLTSEIQVPENQKLHVEFGADEKYDIVSAASIVAKSEREKHIDQISDDNEQVGSGYPSDPTTREFLNNYIQTNGEPPEFARKSWSTVQDMLDERTD